jgi:hypothetical protein
MRESYSMRRGAEEGFNKLNQKSNLNNSVAGDMKQYTRSFMLTYL